MRSRYSAYVLQLTNYVHATWHPSTRPAELSFDDEQTKWLGLDVRQHSQQADTASVEFVARYKINGRAFRLHEISRFVREESSSEPPSQPRWYYLDGELLDK
jgi:SEC-C motif-containing protein